MTLPAKKTAFTFNHADQVDDLGLQIGVALTIQELFDSRGDELLVYLNAIRDALVATTGAGEIGATNANLTATTVQGQIDEVQAAIDALVVGAIPDGTLELVKLTAAANAVIDGKLAKAGGTMTGALIAQTNTNYATRQVRNVIIATTDPTVGDGENGDLWIKYTATP